ncbi:hypothetical protein BDL97_06G024400 [Sphagnum fallax]|nr:hypothetical protein BDL97_06G024400 [Sphagnum fallax]
MTPKYIELLLFLSWLQMSFELLVGSLDVDNVLHLFTATFLEWHVLLCANKYSVLVMAVEAICHLIYPIKWQHVYIPVLYNAGVGFTVVPTPYLIMGLHSAMDTTNLMDGTGSDFWGLLTMF